MNISYRINNMQHLSVNNVDKTVLPLQILRISIYSFVAICSIAVLSLESKAESEEPAGGATVVSDTLAVHSRMSEDSTVVKQLKKGDTVTVEFEMEKAEWAWCVISEGGEITGYVRCEDLKWEEKKVWESIGSSPVGTGMNTTKVTIVNNQVLVPVKLGYGGKEAEALLLLDTGAVGTIIHGDVAAHLKIELDKAIKVKGTVVGGGTVEARLAQLGYLKIGPHRIPDMIVAVIEHKGPQVMFDGLLGMDFLGSVKYELDMRNQVIRWQW